MSKNVYANGREVSAKKDGNQTIAAMPDVCLSPPSPPAGPIPIPYPNTSTASDTSGGTKTVKIGGDEVGIKNSSNYKKSTGDEAATKSLGMGVNTGTLSDKLIFAAWSFDVKYEGENAIRHMDMTTGNHINMATSSDTGVSVATQLPEAIDSPECEKLAEDNKKEVEDVKKKQAEVAKKKKKNPSGVAVTSAKFEGLPSGNGTWHAVSDNDLVPKGKESSYKTDDMKGKEIPKCAGLVAKRNVKPGPDNPKGTKKGDPKRWSQRGTDSEAKLLGPLMGLSDRAGIKVTLKIYHEFNETPGQSDALPCWSCRETICGAEKCDIKVTLCTNNNKAVKAEDLCDGGVPKPKDADTDSPEKNAFWSAALGNR